MSRAPAASFAAFFPSAPKAARDKATERERFKAQAIGQSSSSSLADVNGKISVDSYPGIITKASIGDNKNTMVDIVMTEDHDTLQGDLLNGVGSASSHTSTVSSTFSAPGQQHAMSTGRMRNLNSLTPVTNTDTSPSRNASPNHVRVAVAASNIIGAATGKSIPLDTPTPPSVIPSAKRVYARDPSRGVKGEIKIFDPDTAPKSKDKKKSRPIYKEFGLEDDAPPMDPRLAKGGRLLYINTDFHKPRSRLRQAPYVLRPYAYDPKTSIGSGPPTQVLVTGYEPLLNFQTVATYFSAFGEVAESSNKLHPLTGVNLGFGTFRYRDSTKRLKTGHFVSAIEAAKKAVKGGHGARLGQKNVTVVLDPDGSKSRRMLEAVENEAQSAAPTPIAKPPASAPKSVDAPKTSGPPPTAPKGPAAYSARPQFRPTVVPIAPPTRPRALAMAEVIESGPISQELHHAPYIYVDNSSVPVMQTTIRHFKKRLKTFSFIDLRADRWGYYITFNDSTLGRREMERCLRAINGTKMFTYDMMCKAYAYGTSGSQSQHHVSEDRTRRRSRTPEHRTLENRQRQEEEARRREEEQDWEDEKKERAKNFDPAREAIEVIRRELKDQLLRNVKSKIAASTLHAFMDPANHVAKRRKLNITDSSDLKLPLINEDLDSQFSPITGTPNSRLDSVDKRGMAGRLNVTALPRIRKAKAGKGRNVGFTDPFARARPEIRKAFVRPLHHRLIESEDESDDDTESRSRTRTEEPESRSRSRLSTEEASDTETDILSGRDHRPEGSIDTRDDDSMSEASFLTNEAAPSKKRKLDLQIEVARKRQKKTDEELFGVAPERIESELALTGVLHNTIMEDIGAKSAKKGNKTKKKSKTQIFKEREEAKRKEAEGIYIDELMRTTVTPPADEMDLDEDYIRYTSPIQSTVEWGMSKETPQPTVADDFENVLDLDGLQNFVKDDEDAAIFVSLSKLKIKNTIKDVSTWAWMQEDVKTLNRGGCKGCVTTETAVEGYYVPNKSGCARTEPYGKILNSEKSKYLPHRIKVQKVREERQRQAKKAGRDPAAEAAEAARFAAEKLQAKGNSRASRVNNRRYVADLNDQKKSLGEDADVLRFNQLMRRKKPVKFARSAIHNWGLYAMENIGKDDMIIEYVGEKVRQQVSEVREIRYTQSGIGSSYLFRIDDATVIDATKKGGIARFINHSCMPNCTARIITVEKSSRIVIYAMRDIAQNEELTYDYKFEREFDSTDRIPCLCGTAACKGFLN